MEGRKHRDGGVIWGNVENYPWSCGSVLRLAAAGRRDRVRRRCAQPVPPNDPTDGGGMRVVVEEGVKGSAHRGEEANSVPWSVRWGGSPQPSGAVGQRKAKQARLMSLLSSSAATVDAMAARTTQPTKADTFSNLNGLKMSRVETRRQSHQLTCPCCPWERERERVDLVAVSWELGLWTPWIADKRLEGGGLLSPLGSVRRDL